MDSVLERIEHFAKISRLRMHVYGYTPDFAGLGEIIAELPEGGVVRNALERLVASGTQLETDADLDSNLLEIIEVIT